MKKTLVQVAFVFYSCLGGVFVPPVFDNSLAATTQYPAVEIINKRGDAMNDVITGKLLETLKHKRIKAWVNEFQLSNGTQAAQLFRVIVGKSAVARMESVERNAQRPMVIILLDENDYKEIKDEHQWIANGVAAGAIRLFILNQPLGRKLALLRSLDADIKKVAVVVSDTSSFPPESFANSLQPIELVPVHVNAKTRLAQAQIRESIRDADAVIHQDMRLGREITKLLIYYAYELRKPLIGYSRSYVHAGGVGAVYTDIDGLIDTIVGLLELNRQDITLKTGGMRDSPWKVEVNPAVAESLKLAAFDEDRLVKQIRSIESALQNENKER